MGDSNAYHRDAVLRRPEIHAVKIFDEGTYLSDQPVYLSTCIGVFDPNTQDSPPRF